MKVYYLIFPALFLAACAPQVPESGRGVGFGDRQPVSTTIVPVQDAPLISPNVISQEDAAAPSDATATLGTSSDSGLPLQNLASAEAGADNAIAPSRDTSGISDEQNFDAVSSRETIESDAARREAQKLAYKVIEPVALPERSASSGPSVVEFALSTSNPVGQSLYRRTGISSPARFQRNCAKFASADLAQQAFLKAGGPKRDMRGVDPDGDGFACFWDPAPYRLAVSN